jgi:hypothetical protein
VDLLIKGSILMEESMIFPPEKKPCRACENKKADAPFAVGHVSARAAKAQAESCCSKSVRYVVANVGAPAVLGQASAEPVEEQGGYNGEGRHWLQSDGLTAV